ncbi:FAD-dependent pyridine nucleotide-disulfide oxidoreductase [mine drainage metagenome]|uniref:FAD-dependent pyridine nucleotide-disulfide oxidoreductase n=1 Tax=mine drainage metagenome TaxID=410659 RepID=T1CC66_9ZZZZ
MRFSLNGRFASALPGETLAQALLRHGPRPLARSIRYHRPRGPFCGIGQCTGCLMTVNGLPNVRACQTVPQEGDTVRDQNAWPTVQHDALAILDRLFPAHVDTLHGFRSPAFLTPVYQRVVRRLAGYGEIPSAKVPPSLFPPGSDGRRMCSWSVGVGPAAASRTLSRGPYLPRRCSWSTGGGTARHSPVTSPGT